VRAGEPDVSGGAVSVVSGALLHGLWSRRLESLPEEVHGVRAGSAVLLPEFVDGPAVKPSPVLLGEAVLRLAAALGGEDGALVVLEDLHWACGDTLAVIEYLADSAAMERVVVLGTSRPQGPALPLIDALDRRGSAAVRVLTPIAVGVADFGALVPAGAALGHGSAVAYVHGLHHALVLARRSLPPAQPGQSR